MTDKDLEQKAKELLKANKPVHGYAMDLVFDAALREMWEQENKTKNNK